MIDGRISPLRRRMIEDMNVRHFAANTQETYIRAVEKLARFLGRSPASATPEDLRRFQLHMTASLAMPATINLTTAALRFFFTVTLDRPDVARRLTFIHEPRKLPVVLSQEGSRAPPGSCDERQVQGGAQASPMAPACAFPKSSR